MRVSLLPWCWGKNQSKGRKTRLIEDEWGALIAHQALSSNHLLFLSLSSSVSLPFHPCLILFLFHCLALSSYSSHSPQKKWDLKRSAWHLQWQPEEAGTQARKISVILGLTSLWESPIRKSLLEDPIPNDCMPSLKLLSEGILKLFIWMMFT